MSQTATKATRIPDVQGSADTRHLAINKVGIKDIRHPVIVKDRSDGVQRFCRISSRAHTCRAL